MAARLTLPHGLRVMEFGAALDAVAAHAGTGPGAAHVRALRPTGDAELAGERLALADEMVSLVLRHDWASPALPDVRAAFDRLSIEGSALDEAQLVGVGRLLGAARSTRRDLRNDPDGLPRLRALSEGLLDERKLEERLERSFGPTGELSDDASPELKRIRRELRGSRSDMVRRLEAFVRQLPARYQVPDASVTVRAGRYCVPIRREGASRVGGIVHDESATHQTLFVEPPGAIEPMNRIASLEREERREIHRVLLELSDVLRPLAEDLRVTFDTLAEADSLAARARYALAHGGKRPRLAAAADAAPVEIVDGVHPLLLAGGEPAVPFSLRLGPEERVLLISGPNAGGKTVTLKAIGLLSALAQSGVLPPVGDGTCLPVFDRFFAVIGDEQSISASLSTFSAQVAALGEILEDAGPGSLVLLDEIGSATDPSEGAALAAAVLLRLAEEARLTVATTHLGALKDLPVETPAIVNASLQFDAGELRPSFALVRDRPGRSYALEIAKRLGLPDEIVETARGRLTGSERRMEEVLAELEKAEAELERLTSGARADARAAARRVDEVEERARALEAREREAERKGREAADRYLLDARREVEATIEALEARAEEGAARDAATEARRRVEDALRRNRERAADAAPASGAEGPGEAAPDVSEGEWARSRSLGVSGRVVETRPGKVVLESGGMRVTIDAGDAEPAEIPSAGSTGRRPISQGTPGPEIEAHPEVDLRGLRVDEVRAPLLAALDAAIVADLGRLVVIHGKGTGALREEVGRLVDGDARIARVRLGGFDEGGSGVTVLELNPSSGGRSN